MTPTQPDQGTAISPSTVYAAVGVSRVINAAGKMTALGGSAQSDSVAGAQAAAAQAHVDLGQLRQHVAERIAALCRADAASLTSGAAAGIAIAVAATIAGTDARAITALPGSTGRPNRILLLAGHDVNFGAPVRQMVALGGGRVDIIGAVNRATAAEFAATLRAHDDIAAALYVQSHHAQQDNMVALDEMIALCAQQNVPVIVDAAAETDLTFYTDAGADLVTYSGGKAIGGPTSGFICGRQRLIEACEAQQSGIGRAMKLGKEQIVGLAYAIAEYADKQAVDKQAAATSSTSGADIAHALLAALQAIPRLSVVARNDDAGRAIMRPALLAAPATLRALVRHLDQWTPSIRTRNHHLDAGVVQFDPRELQTDDVPVISAAVAAFDWPDQG